MKSLLLLYALGITPGSNNIMLSDEGAKRGLVDVLNCTGSGITCYKDGGIGYLSVTGGSGGGGGSSFEWDGGPGATRTDAGSVTTSSQEFEGLKVFFADAGTNATAMNGTIVVVNTSNPASGSSNIAFANPEVSVSGSTPTIGGFVGYNEQSVASGTTGHVVVAAGVGRGVRLQTNGAVNFDCHGQACGVGGTTGNPAVATLQVADIGVAGINVAVTSGNNALAVGSNGGRIDHGAGASDYSSSDGTTVTYAGPLAASNLSGTNTGDQTKTCGAGEFIQQIAAGTGSVCGTPSGSGGGISYAEAAAATMAGF